MDIPAGQPDAPRFLPQVRATMGEPEVLAFLNWLVVDHRVAHSTQMQALSALLFLYRDVLRTPLGNIRGLLPARGPVRLPVMFTATRSPLSSGTSAAAPGWWRCSCTGRGSG